MLPVLMLAALVAAFLLAIAAIFRFVPKDGAKSISNHAASSRRTYWILAATLVLTGIPTYYLLWRWFMPVLELPEWFGYVLVFGFTCLMLTAFVPDKPGWKHRVHWYVAYGVGITMIAIMFAVAVAGQVTMFSRLLALAFVVA